MHSHFMSILKRKQLAFFNVTMAVIVAGMMVFMAISTGCAPITTSKMCTNIPEGTYSVICQAAEAVGTTPETVSKMFRITDLLLLNETHTAEQAYLFIDDLQKAAKKAKALGPVSLKRLFDYAMAKYKILPPKVQAALVLVEPFETLDIQFPDLMKLTLPEYDWYHLDLAFESNKAILLPFMPGIPVRVRHEVVNE